MADKSLSEALDSVLKSLRKFEADFGVLTGRLREIGGISSLSVDEAEKLKSVKAHLSTFQREISDVVNYGSHVTTQVSVVPLAIRCKNWEDFKSHAFNANTLSFLYRDEEKTFQVDAFKEGKVYTYSGKIPSGAKLLRTWLSKELGVAEEEVLEGLLTIG
ncbi:MAG: hypothetical protein K6T73_08915 [Candidatus Bathyarchaeota archaeon]|nr:hypothetical protein [Candidatus Bathyarchaeota archaeon]